MEHVCYVWAKQHPDTGYFQGFSDLVVPFFVVFSVTFASPDGLMALSSGRARRADVLSQLDWDSLEADTYWCLCRMLRMLPADLNAPPPSVTLLRGGSSSSSSSSSASSSSSNSSLSSSSLTTASPPPSNRTTADSLVDDPSAPTDEAAIDAARSEDWHAMHNGLSLRCLWGVQGLAQIRGVLPTASHPGIHAMVRMVREVVAFYDPKLYDSPSGWFLNAYLWPLQF